MYTISEQLKLIYKNDFIPAVPQNYFKYLLLYFPDISLTIDTRDSGRVDIDSFSLDESLCSASDLTLGSCEASMLKIKINGIVQDLTGKKVIVTQYVQDGDISYEMPFGTFWVNSAGKQSDLGFKEITAFDGMKNTDVDVSAWYNGLTWPQTVKSMRESLLTYLGLEYEVQTLTNDTVQLSKTVNTSSLIGRDILRRITEINAGFGHFTRDGKFKVIQLSGLGLYPSEELYPAEDLFPSESGEYITAGYESADYEEYIVEPITSVTAREDDEDTGATAGTPGNNYIITGNFLLYGKSGSELQTIVDNIFLQVKNKYYRPHNTTMIGLPYMEVGDSVTIITSNDAIESFIFKRTLTGIQALKDNISASGNQVRDQKVSPATEMQQTKSKVLKIQKSVDGLSATVSDLDQQLSGEIDVLAGKVVLKVNSSGRIALVELDADPSTGTTLQLSADNINLSGYTTFSNLNTPGQVVIDGGNLKAGTVLADTVRTDWVYSNNISANQITSGILNGIVINSPYECNFASVKVKGTSSATTEITPLTVETTYITCTTLNNGTPITTANRTSYTYPPSSHSHTTSGDISATTDGSGGISFSNGLSAAGYHWVDDNFQRKTSSDIRLKKNYRTLSELPLSLYMELKPYLYEFKIKDYGEGSAIGFMAQQVEQAFEKYGLNPFDYNLVQKRDPRDGTDEDQYVFLDKKVHYINYENMHAWTAHVLQQVVEKVFPEVIASES
ncbi:tail fiber domain-containing protein [Anaerocolumna chitinilytica]|uniref:Peptidase S74 domain-containing protein n=1 Tax=Anaerocolumna chitinilytica TaxID=1727145 RepID=A0A7M3SAH6_9FIRM|nr:tail fiber domain-containing protein [Anaerocolumna chitinilytica]BCK01594.1 hypothetical protein bsdcttw_46340 [Anaerocolumna chitinilytica]